MGALTAGTVAQSGAQAETPAPQAKEDISPFTGLPAEPAPVMAVKLDNHPDARPHTALEKADMVVVEQVEGGLSRLIGVYASQQPERIGPVRSARDYNIEQLRMFDRPALAYSGAAKGTEELIQKSPLYALSNDTFPSGYVRDEAGEPPHNLYAQPDKILDAAPDASLSSDIGFRFGAEPKDGVPTEEAHVEYPSASTGFSWSEKEDRWLASFDGEPAENAKGERLGGKTVVIQEVDMRPSEINPKTPYIETVGEGKATVLRDGAAFDTTWKRTDAEGDTTFTRPNGDRMPFDRGQVWVVYKER
ncbi:DUF3048 domain-containing protein [Streptomyces oceani]|uniref:DUF3048 domain-containing protein n=1 Tax=Streptomyces oceani TaxID=1075402 RepID=UPI001BB0CC23|nr:DUF3048 domain-containing protein [Streptomyces oceani]